MNEEQYLRGQLVELHRSYQKACEPIVKRLAAIESMKPPQPMLFSLAQWHALQNDEVPK